MELYRTGWLDVILTSAVALSAIMAIAGYFTLPSMGYEMRWYYATGLPNDPIGVIEFAARHRPNLVTLVIGLSPVPLWLIVNMALPRDEPEPAARTPLLLAATASVALSILAMVAISTWFTALPDMPVWLAAVLAGLLVVAIAVCFVSAWRLSGAPGEEV